MILRTSINGTGGGWRVEKKVFIFGWRMGIVIQLQLKFELILT
jgi:hypothetical protein